MKPHHKTFASKRLSFLISVASGASLMAGAMSLAVPAFAQGPGADEQIEEILVSGYRASVASAISIKKESDQFVDSIVAADIGKLPDMNVAESLQRISGIQITRHMGEGSSIAIRGLTHVRTELNGRSSFTANNGRGLSFEDVPAELMAGVDVYKNPSAELIEGGIGGTVNLRTFKPFDFDGLKLSASLGMNHYDFIDDEKPQMSGLFSNRWDTSLGEIGFLVNLSYQESVFRQDTVVTEPFWLRDAGEFGGEAGQDIYVPAGSGINSSFGDRERMGLAVALQWAPSEDLEFYAQHIRSDYEMTLFDYSYFAFLPAEDDAQPMAPYDVNDFTFSSSGDFLTGSFADVNIDSNTGLNRRNSVTADTAFGFKFTPNDQLTLSGDVQYVDAKTRGENFIISVNALAPVLHMDLRGDYPGMSVAPKAGDDPSTADLTNPANYNWSWLIPHHDKSKGTELAVRFDGEWEFVDAGPLQSFSAGVRFTDREARNQSMQWSPWTPIRVHNWQCTDWDTGGPLMPECNPDNLQPEDWSNQGNWGVVFPLDDPRFGGNWSYNQFTDFMRGKSDSYGVTLAASSQLVGSFSDEVVRYLTGNHLDAGSRLDGIPEFGPLQTNNQEEKTSAIYGMLRFATELGNIPVDGNLGVRVVETRVNSSGSAESCDQDGNNCSYSPISYDKDYVNVLPSLNVKFALADNVFWRFAASEGVSRPGFDQMDPNVNLSISIDSATSQITGLHASGGNPELEPMEVSQFDTSLEWYFSDSGMTYATLFYKDVKNFIARGTIHREMSYNNPLTNQLETGRFESEVPLNGDKGKIQGMEVGVSAFLDFLPGAWSGLGFQANYTYVDSEAPSPFSTDLEGNALMVPLEGLSENSYNLVGMYEWGDWSFRLAYNWRDDYLRTTSGNGTQNLPIYNKDYGQLDASLNWRINDNFSLRLDGVNLTDSRTDTYQGFKNRHRDSFLGDRRYGVTLRADF